MLDIRPPSLPSLPTLAVLLLPLLALPACGIPSGQPVPAVDGRVTAEGPAPEQYAFWGNLQALCGQAFTGEMLDGPETSDWWEAELVMHVRECEEDVIRIPLHVGDDRSRTWVVTRTDAGLQLKHDHRLPDGTPDVANTDYGGHTEESGSATRQEFPADDHSVAAVPARATQHWFLEVHPGEMFAYGLLREETGLSYRIEFDLTEPVEAPPAPWGWD